MHTAWRDSHHVLSCGNAKYFMQTEVNQIDFATVHGSKSINMFLHLLPAARKTFSMVSHHAGSPTADNIYCMCQAGIRRWSYVHRIYRSISVSHLRYAAVVAYQIYKWCRENKYYGKCGNLIIYNQIKMFVRDKKI